ncbi:hypothetical protein GCM10009613_19930 [Pseudonocardia kongjuensis]|uniref:Uncharacterized protein n=1 Tax=Pseudonocardia kongjuensis TaxID=102227 RepID=A0ABN1XUC1_9PSEU
MDRPAPLGEELLTAQVRAGPGRVEMVPSVVLDAEPGRRTGEIDPVPADRVLQDRARQAAVVQGEPDPTPAVPGPAGAPASSATASQRTR